MKKALIILGAVFVVFVVVGVAGFAVVAIKGSALDKDSKAYVDEVLPVICADLGMETLFEVCESGAFGLRVSGGIRKSCSIGSKTG